MTSLLHTTGVHELDPSDEMYVKGCRFVAVSASGTSSYHSTFEVAQRFFDERQQASAHFWHEKVHWQFDGDRTPDGGHVLRIDGRHYVALHLGVKANSGVAGFGGRTLRWRDLRTGEIEASNNVWCQGEIPEHLRNRLPDNAVWITEEAAA